MRGLPAGPSAEVARAAGARAAAEAAAAASEVAAARASLAGTKLRDYEIIRKVGGKDTEAAPTMGGGYSQSGVCSYVYLARRVGDARQLAVKVMIG